MQHIENPMIITDIAVPFELHVVHECCWCGCEMEDETDVYDDGCDVYCADCLLDKYRLG
jgi:hypothetical protein